MDKQIDTLLKHDIIRPSESAYSSPILLVKKKGKAEYRCVIDFRKLNSQTVKSALPLPLLEECLDNMGGSSSFCLVDFKSGFFQLELAEEDKHKTAFTTGTELYEFNRLPQGLCNSPGTFQALMEKVLKGMNGKQCVIYLDDVCFFSKCFEDTFKALQEAFGRFRAANLTLRVDKCKFFMREIKFLGHILNEQGIAPDPDNLIKVKEWPRPTNPKEVKGFVALCGYYRRMVKDFAQIASPLHALTKKDVNYEWSEECEHAFTTLREKLVTQPIVTYPNFDKPFALTCDASSNAVGAVLSQEVDGIDKVVYYYSASLSPTARRYCTFDREFFAIVSAIRKFRHYLLGAKFTIYTDHQPLTRLRTLSLDRLTDPHNRRSRWMSEIDPLNWNILYKPGSTNINADQLSRHPSVVKEVLLRETNVTGETPVQENSVPYHLSEVTVIQGTTCNTGHDNSICNDNDTTTNVGQSPLNASFQSCLRWRWRP